MAQLKSTTKRNEVINKLYKGSYKSTKRVGHVKPEDKVS